MIKIHFHIRFHTQFGESLHLSGNIPELGNFNTGAAVAMDYLNEEYWTFTLELHSAPQKLPPILKYRYVYIDKSGGTTEEWDDAKQIAIPKIPASEIQVVDSWNTPGHYLNVFFTAPFRNVLLPGSPATAKAGTYTGHSHYFKVKAPLLLQDEAVGLLGGSAELGNWNTAQPCKLYREKDWWTLKLDLSQAAFPIAYKYAIYNKKTGAFIRYEEGDNRLLHDNGSSQKFTIIHDGFFHYTHAPWKGVGVNIPVFSLRSRESLGVGEFTDIKLLVDWAGKTGIRLIQLLPVNDTTATRTWKDSYPYNAVSAFALHPLYLNIQSLLGEEESQLARSVIRRRKQLNALDEVDYEEVMRYKWDTIKKIYNQKKQDCFESADYRKFMETNQHWLVPYAAYSYLRDKFKTADFTQWKQYAVYKKTAIEKLTAKDQKHFDDVAVYYFVQFHLHQQLKAAVEYAHHNGIVLKGDIPIGVNRNSCDAWMEPELFHMDMQAGAPPDAFSEKGQNWEFPTYNWERMQQNRYDWWKRRFTQMSHYFDAFRLDHVLGFFRIWSVPRHAVEGVMGHFVPAIPVDVSAFQHNGIDFDFNRYCTPFITDSVLQELLGDKQQRILNFLDSPGEGRYVLKPAFATQRQVEQYFAALEVSEDNQWLQSVLFRLIANVILFEAEGSAGTRFHFRIDMERTTSFRYLDEVTRQKLKELYEDYFFRKQEALWAKEALQKLPALSAATQMMICGEDLGMVPHCVPEVMQRCGFLSLEIQRMPKQPGLEFFNPANAPVLSVVTPSTHDMSTIRGWWEENRELTQHFFSNEMQHPGLAPYYCEPWVNKAIVIQHLYSPALWSIFLLQDLMGIDGKLRREKPAMERINVPAIPRYYWRYRMHITLEQLLKEDDFNNELISYIRSSGRGEPNRAIQPEGKPSKAVPPKPARKKKTKSR